MATADGAPGHARIADELAAELRAAAEAGLSVRVRGAGTKLSWARPGGDSSPTVELSTAGLDRIVEHNAGDLTAVLEAGVPLADAQAPSPRPGQMLALDPPDRRRHRRRDRGQRRLGPAARPLRRRARPRGRHDGRALGRHRAPRPAAR